MATIKELKAECKRRGIRNYSTLKKNELINLLGKNNKKVEKTSQGAKTIRRKSNYSDIPPPLPARPPKIEAKPIILHDTRPPTEKEINLVKSKLRDASKRILKEKPEKPMTHRESLFEELHKKRPIVGGRYLNKYFLK